MKNKLKITRLLLVFISLILFFVWACGPEETRDRGEEGFTLAFLPDIHLQPELKALEAFDKAIQSVNELKPDLVLTGGDLIMDALEVPFERADQLFGLYRDKIKGFKMKVYHTIGNHDIFGWYKESGVDQGHQSFGKKLYEAQVAERYYSFNHKNWHFIILDSVQRSEEGGYIGKIDRQQIDWIRTDLQKIRPETPIVISTHIPFVTVNVQLRKGALEPVRPSTLITNGNEVLDLFRDYNLKLVLQGHLHCYEEIRANGVTFITGGAVSAGWWEGPYNGLEEGYVSLKLLPDRIVARYVDYGWQAEVKKKDS
jgi:3',5'-cyclic AMP phosphodiesterase CpdA